MKRYLFEAGLKKSFAIDDDFGDVTFLEELVPLNDADELPPVA